MFVFSAFLTINVILLIKIKLKGIVITIEAKHEHKIKELKSKIDELETENAILKKHCNFSDAENTYDEYDNLKFSPEKVIETDDHQ